MGRKRRARRINRALAQEYPDTDEGKNAQYARINGALELEQFDQAREALGAMLASPGSYSEGEFVRVGQAMLDKEQWTEAEQAFSQVVGKTDDRALLERALYGIGAARYELGQYAGAVESLDDLMRRWPNSARQSQTRPRRMLRPRMASPRSWKRNCPIGCGNFKLERNRTGRLVR